MRRIIVPLLILFLLASVSPMSPPLAVSARTTRQEWQAATQPKQLIVGYKPGFASTAYHSAALNDCIVVKGDIAALSVKLVEVLPGCSAEQIAQGISADGSIAYVEPNTLMHALTPTPYAPSNVLALSPNDPFFRQQWALAKIAALSGWNVFPGRFDASGGAPIAIVDTGIDGSNPDFAGKIVRPTTFVDGSEPLVDEEGHGTAVAAVAVAAANNGSGIAGLAFNSPVVPVKITSGSSATVFDIANGIHYAADPSGGAAKVVNLSFGGPDPSQTLFRAIDFARSHGVLLVSSAGNCGEAENPICGGEVNVDKWPAAFSTSLDNIIAAAATDENDLRAPFSNFGNFVTVAAPGTNIIADSPLDPSGVQSVSGTSFSAPYVAGLAALLFSQDPSRSYQTVKAIIQQSADKVGDQAYDASGRNNFLGFGRINVLRALQTGGAPPPSPTGVDGKIEVVFPHDTSGNPTPVTGGTLVNIQVLLFASGSLQPVPCTGGPTVQLWRSLNNQPAELAAQTGPQTATSGGTAFPSWAFNDVNVSAAQDPANKYYFFLRAPGQSGFHTNVWSHGADARTIFPVQDVPTAVATQQPIGPLDGKIEIVFPHDVAGNPQPVAQAPLVNLAVDVFLHGTLQSVPLDFSRPVRLVRSLNNDVENAVFEGQRTTVTNRGITYPQWVFNDIDVSAAQNPLNKYYFRVDLDFPTIWAHGADARTIFPQKDVPTASGAGCQ